MIFIHTVPSCFPSIQATKRSKGLNILIIHLGTSLWGLHAGRYNNKSGNTTASMASNMVKVNENQSTSPSQVNGCE